jgi:tRNA(fMet)-specific endonuclease VapC
LTLSLDANVLIDLANGRRPLVRANLDAAVLNNQAIYTCSFCAHELLYGAAISGRPDFQLKTANALLESVKVAEFTLDDARAAAELRALLRRSGNPIGAVDTLIAGQALARGWTIVTANLREFHRVVGLTVIDWREASEIPLT